MTNQSNAAQNTNTREENKINIKPIPFTSLMKSKMISTKQLGSLLFGLFSTIFPEYEGCIIVPDNVGNIQTTLYFKDRGHLVDEDRLKAVVPAGTQQNTNNAFSRIAGLNQRLSSKKYELTDEAKDFLSRFFWTRGNQKVNWNQVVSEITSRDNWSGQTTIHVVVTGLDITRILKTIYGNKDGDRNYLDYGIFIARTINPNPPIPNYVFNIVQFSQKEMENLVKEMGIIPVQGSLPLLRD